MSLFIFSYNGPVVYRFLMRALCQSLLRIKGLIITFTQPQGPMVDLQYIGWLEVHIQECAKVLLSRLVVWKCHQHGMIW